MSNRVTIVFIDTCRVWVFDSILCPIPLGYTNHENGFGLDWIIFSCQSSQTDHVFNILGKVGAELKVSKSELNKFRC